MPTRGKTTPLGRHSASLVSIPGVIELTAVRGVPSEGSVTGVGVLEAAVGEPGVGALAIKLSQSAT